MMLNNNYVHEKRSRNPHVQCDENKARPDIYLEREVIKALVPHHKEASPTMDINKDIKKSSISYDHYIG